MSKPIIKLKEDSTNSVVHYSHPTNPILDFIHDIESIFYNSPFGNYSLSTIDNVDGLKRYTNTSFSTDKYPPHNHFVEKDGTQVLEFALAGYNKDELSVQLEDNLLTISGSKQSDRSYNSKDNVTDAPNEVYMYHQGLAYRSFIKTFIIPEFSEINDVSLKDGLLTIKIVKNIPEYKKPKLLEIKT